MSIFNHFKHLNLSQGQETTLTKLEAFLASSVQVFMLKGYAGSGKTTILKGLIEYLKENNKDFVVMAPTGRATKILRDKTGYGSTIHRGIYKLDKMEAIRIDAEDVAEQSFHYYFPIQDIGKENRIIIVDESSMISSNKSSQELFSYGTDILFNDLLTYAKIKTTNTKIIFVGDPAQLPPVGDNKSKAFDGDFYNSNGIRFDEVEMEHVFRQDSESGLILKNATKIRQLLKESYRNKLSFEFDQKSMIELSSIEVATKFVEIFPTPALGNGVIINYSNTQAYSYNVSIREKLFPDFQNIVEGDIVMINNNNYSYYETELFNGDLAMVLEVSSNVETISAPVMVGEGANKVRKIITLKLREVILRLNNTSTEIKCKIFDHLLNSPKGDLTVDELKAIYINFVMRFNVEQESRKKNGQEKFKVGSEEFKNAIRRDPYTNALRIKYGYAVTCHKAQGGEWDTVFVDYTGRVGLNNDALRWNYTATTRAVITCYAINPPYFSAFTSLTFSDIIRTTHAPANALFLKNVPLSPFHKPEQHKCKSQKYWEVLKKLNDSVYVFKSVESRGEYLERYTFQLDDKEIIAQTNHNLAGFFGDFQIITTGDYNELSIILNSPTDTIITLEYNPSSKALSELYSQVQNNCIEFGISLTNVNETVNNFYVTYHFRTSGLFSNIQFYYNINGQFTKANPKSDLGKEDLKLIQLIQKLSQDAI